MRIYLDSCVCQYLKKAEQNEILERIILSKNENIYCFSEAHIYDLANDKTEYKFTDMDFLEKIVDNNCYYYDKGIQHKYYTPREYYDACDWNDYHVPLNQKYLFADPVFDLFKVIPLDIKSLIPPEFDLKTIPKEYEGILDSSTTLYDFMSVMLNFTDNISREQKRFKELLEYLHGNSKLLNFYNYLGIEGYDGNKITDVEKFRNTYSEYCTKYHKAENQYTLFTNMYNALEFSGIIKGKPKKQKMSNMINDARHAYWGSYCDIVVSIDEDFIEKTKFMYSFLELDIPVLTLREFENELQNTISGSNNLEELLSEASLNNKEPYHSHVDSNGMTTYYYSLNKIYLGCFDCLRVHIHNDFNYFSFTKQLKNNSSGTLTKEIANIVTILNKKLPIKIGSKGEFNNNEIINDQWNGRAWAINQTIFELSLHQKLFLNIYTPNFLDYTEKTIEK